MKNVSKKLLLLACAAAIIFLQVPRSFAGPTVQWPLTADQTWVVGTSNPIQGINTAQICYNSMSPMAISAVVYYDGSGTEQINLYDNYFFISYSFPYAAGALNGVPDIILGDNLQFGANPLTDFLATVAFVNTYGDVEVDVYSFSDNFGAFSGGSLLNSVTSAGSGYAPQTVHIDNEMDATGYWGFPTMSGFALTWDDWSTGPDVYAVMGDMNSASLVNFGGSTLISNYGYMPDIAGVNCSPSATNGYSAWISYVDGGGNELWGAFYQPLSSTLITQKLDDGSASSSVTAPRIACIPTGSGVLSFNSSVSTFMVTAQALDFAGLYEIRNYDPPALPFSTTGWTISNVEDITSISPYSGYAPHYNDYLPTVAIGAQDYLTLHFMDYSSPGQDVLMLEPMDWINWKMLASPNDYYWVNSQSNPSIPVVYPTPTQAANYYACAEATPCNSSQSTSISAWAFLPPGSTNYQIDYKFSNPAAGSIAFRQPQPAAQAAPEAPKLDVYPNPATSVLTIANVTGVQDVTYEVTNMAGQMVMQGALSGAVSSLDVNRLTPGNYIIKMHNSAVSSDVMFTKQ